MFETGEKEIFKTGGGKNRGGVDCALRKEKNLPVGKGGQRHTETLGVVQEERKRKWKT